jgi:hypothetical protein
VQSNIQNLIKLANMDHFIRKIPSTKATVELSHPNPSTYTQADDPQNPAKSEKIKSMPHVTEVLILPPYRKLKIDRCKTTTLVLQFILSKRMLI